MTSRGTMYPSRAIWCLDPIIDRNQRQHCYDNTTNDQSECECAIGASFDNNWGAGAVSCIYGRCFGDNTHYREHPLDVLFHPGWNWCGGSCDHGWGGLRCRRRGRCCGLRRRRRWRCSGGCCGHPIVKPQVGIWISFNNTREIFRSPRSWFMLGESRYTPNSTILKWVFDAAPIFESIFADICQFVNSPLVRTRYMTAICNPTPFRLWAFPDSGSVPHDPRTTLTCSTARPRRVISCETINAISVPHTLSSLICRAVFTYSTTTRICICTFSALLTRRATQLGGCGTRRTLIACCNSCI
jgi:hypothetical protein